MMRPDIPYNTILCRYGEIALKKQNRRKFEHKLMDNIRASLRGFADIKVKRLHGRMYVHRPDFQPFMSAEIPDLEAAVTRVFGLTSISFGLQIEPDLEAIEAAILANFPKVLKGYDTEAISYRMRARRSNKQFPLHSKQLEIHFAEILTEKYPSLSIDLSDDADLTIYLEIRDQWAFISFDSVACPGGLPVGSSAPALSLLSGGIDSPVASQMMMSRGCPIDYITFHSYPYTTPDLLEKVARLADILNKWQGHGRLFACNMSEAQKLIRDHCQARFRTILYRRLMFRVAEVLAKKLGCTALVTGESLGQVASQTVPNLDSINASTDMLVLRPLLALDKMETVRRAREIGTYDVSNIQCADSCTVFMPDSPATNARRFLLDHEETKLDKDHLLRLCLEGMSLVSIPDGDEEPLPFEFTDLDWGHDEA